MGFLPLAVGALFAEDSRKHDRAALVFPAGRIRWSYKDPLACAGLCCRSTGCRRGTGRACSSLGRQHPRLGCRPVRPFPCERRTGDQVGGDPQAAAGPDAFAGRSVLAWRATVLSGETVSASQAYAWGLVHRLTPVGRALDTALEMAGFLACLAPVTLTTGKAIMHRDGMVTASEVAALFRTADAAEGMEAFTEKRKPRFQGR